MSLKQKEHATMYYESQGFADLVNVTSTSKNIVKEDFPGILQFIPLRDEFGKKVKLSLDTCKLIKIRYTTLCKLKELVIPGPMIHILIGKECLVSFKNPKGFTLADVLQHIGYMTMARNKLLCRYVREEEILKEFYLIDITYDSQNHILVPIFQPILPE